MKADDRDDMASANTSSTQPAESSVGAEGAAPSSASDHLTNTEENTQLKNQASSGSADADALGVSLRGSMAADALFGDVDEAGLDKNDQSDALNDGDGDDYIWGDEVASDEELDIFVKQTGTGTDYIHDFEVEADVVDLSAYNITFNDLKGAMEDVGWATQIELTGFSGQVDDRIFLKNVEPDQLDESNFSL